MNKPCTHYRLRRRSVEMPEWTANSNGCHRRIRRVRSESSQFYDLGLIYGRYQHPALIDMT